MSDLGFLDERLREDEANVVSARDRREVLAKRDLVEVVMANPMYRVAEVMETICESEGQEWSSLTDDRHSITRPEFIRYRRIIRSLMFVYADHPDYPLKENA